MLHDHLESTSLLARLTNTELQIDDYIDILKRYFGLLTRFEEQVADHSGWAVINRQPETCRKSPLLKKDLNTLGVDPSNHGHPATADLSFECQSVSQFMGTFYVIEGSSLGGIYIAKHLQQHLGLTANNGASYFHGYGADTAGQWKQFCGHLARYGETIPDPKPVVDAAQHAFSTFHQAMSGR